MYASLGVNFSRYAMPSLSIEDPFLGGGARAALCVRAACHQGKGAWRDPRAGLAWICDAWVCWLIGTLRLVQQRTLGALFRPAAKWSAS